MKKYLVTLLILLLNSSCINMSVLTKKDHRFYLEVKNAEISAITPSEWQVGPKNKQIVHRGVKVKIELPSMKKEDLSTLIHEKKIDAIVVKIERSVRGTLIPIGHLNIPINTKGMLPKFAFFFVDYYAAGIRPSHTRYKCPPYGHDYRVSDLSIRNSSKKEKKMVISSQYEKRIKGSEVSRFVYNGQHFVAGKDVLGSYRLHFAFFDNISKTLKSEYHEFDQYFSIGAHQKHSIKGCPANTGDGILQGDSKFNWNR